MCWPIWRVRVGQDVRLLYDATIRVDGAERPFVPGMGGTARVVVERRRLIAYAFAPLMQLREAVANRKRM